MTLNSNKDAIQRLSHSDTTYAAIFPSTGQLESVEQIRRFELLRLAFFALKLRKLEQRIINGHEKSKEYEKEQQFHCNLLRHVIFQQILTLTKLDARGQALQIITACQK